MSEISSQVQVPMMDVTIDGQTIRVPENTTIFQAAHLLKEKGLRKEDIPALCHRPDLSLDPVGVCRLCMVEVEGEKGLTVAASCLKPCSQLKAKVDPKHPVDAAKPQKTSYAVHTDSESLKSFRKTLVEILLIDHPRPCRQHRETQSCELEKLGEDYGLLQPLRQPASETSKFKSIKTVALGDGYGQMPSVFEPKPVSPKIDQTNFSIAVDHSACILCDRCVRACNDEHVAGHKIIGRMGKGVGAQIGFDDNKLMGASGCVNCGWCMVACPTGALVYTGLGRVGGFADALSLEEMEKLDFVIAAKVSRNFLRELQGGIRRVSFKDKELICRQGETGNTAFFIESGNAHIYLEREKTAVVKTSFITRWLTPAAPKARLGLEEQIATVPEKDVSDPAFSIAHRLVGEIGAKNSLPRSATVRAAGDLVMLEMSRAMLDILLRSPGFKEQYEKVHRQRMVQTCIRTFFGKVRELEDRPAKDLLPAAEYLFLESRSELVSFAPNQVIFRKDEEGDSFYVVRLGHVKIVLEGEVISYVGPGEYFGEISLLLNRKRVADCVAANNVEALRIKADDFEQLLRRNPVFAEELRGITAARLSANAKRLESRSEKRTDLQQFAKQELYEGRSLLVIDLDSCTRCDECVKACADSHNGISRMLRDGKRFKNYLVPQACRTCHDAKCIPVCPVNAIYRTSEKGMAVIVQDNCVGCGACFGEDHDGNPTGTGCPYGNIFPVPATIVDQQTGQERKWRKASLCDLDDNCVGEGLEPSCVYACPHEAAKRVDANSEFGQELLAIED